MASLTSLVNQRLACARLLLKDAQSASTPVHEKALLDACLFHLCCGYRFYVRELADYYDVGYVASIDDERGAARALDQMGKTPVEIQELCHLAERGDSWLTQLRALFDNCWEMPLPPAAPDPNAIAVHNLDRVELPELTPALVGEYCRSLQELIERQRETSLEC